MSTAEGQLGMTERTSRAIADALAARKRSWNSRLLFAGPAVVDAVAGDHAIGQVPVGPAIPSQRRVQAAGKDQPP